MSTNKELVLQKTHFNLSKLIEGKRDAMPKGFNETRFIQNCMTVLDDTRNIEKCQPLSIARTLLKGAFLGLDFFMKECYAIPYGNDLQFQTDYKGEIKLAKTYSVRPIKDVYAKLVREGDFFEESVLNGEQTVNFKPLPFNNNQILGAFAVVLFEDGGMDYETMSTWEIEEIRNNFSKMKNSLMWTKTPGEAYKKTVLRRLLKKVSKQFDSVEQSKQYDEAGGMDFDEKKEPAKVPDTFNKSDVVDVSYEEVPETPAQQESPTEDGFKGFSDDEFGDTPFAKEGN